MFYLYLSLFILDPSGISKTACQAPHTANILCTEALAWERVRFYGFFIKSDVI